MAARRRVFGEGANEDGGLSRWIMRREEVGVLFSSGGEEKLEVRKPFISRGWVAGFAVGEVAVPFVYAVASAVPS